MVLRLWLYHTRSAVFDILRHTLEFCPVLQVITALTVQITVSLEHTAKSVHCKSFQTVMSPKVLYQGSILQRVRVTLVVEE